MTATVVMVLLTAACLAGGSSTQRVVRVDFTHDEFASHYWRYFPREVYAHPGDEIVFRQEWTGEPHTVTLGRVVDRAIPRMEAVERKYADAPDTPEVIERAEAEYEKASQGMPTFFPDQADGFPVATQPCYVRSGSVPTRAGEACPQRTQPDFDGRYGFYSSGYIPPSGSKGNTYRVPLADDIEPGEYSFYCVIHFPWMQGKLIVKEQTEELPADSQTNAQARKELEALAKPLRESYAQARADEAMYGDERIDLPMAGYHAGDEFTVGIDEFVPRRVRTKVNEPVTWTIVGAHTISFDVPRYVPIYRVRDDGTVKRNPVVDRAAGGSPKAPGVDFDRHKVEIDGGTWDGSGFFSSGLIGSEPFSKYTLRVSQPGRYKYACLVHPKMVGTLMVRD